MNNRIIKFRIWDKQSLYLYYPEKFSGLFCLNILGDLLKFDHLTKDFEYINNQSDYVIQQFTGLTDKNGCEIYEGDIVKFFNESEHTDKKYWYPVFEVRFSNDNDYVGFNLRYIGGGLSDDISETSNFTLSPHEFQVIDNVFENPDITKCIKNNT